MLEELAKPGQTPALDFRSLSLLLDVSHLSFVGTLLLEAQKLPCSLFNRVAAHDDQLPGYIHSSTKLIYSSRWSSLHPKEDFDEHHASGHLHFGI